MQAQRRPVAEYALGGRYVKTCPLLLLFASSLYAAGQSSTTNAVPVRESSEPFVVRQPPSPLTKETDELRQELDVDAAALSKIPSDPLVQPDPLAPVFQPVDKLRDSLAQSARLKFGATYTFLNQYATVTPDSVRHNQLSGRSILVGHGVSTITKPAPDRSACSSVQAQISASASNLTLATVLAQASI